MVLLVAQRELVRMAGAAPAGGGSSNRQWQQAVGSTGDLRARTCASTSSQLAAVVALERA